MSARASDRIPTGAGAGSGASWSQRSVSGLGANADPGQSALHRALPQRASGSRKSGILPYLITLTRPPLLSPTLAPDGVDGAIVGMQLPNSPPMSRSALKRMKKVGEQEMSQQAANLMTHYMVPVRAGDSGAFSPSCLRGRALRASGRPYYRSLRLLGSHQGHA